jgi:hypothetical protein
MRYAKAIVGAVIAGATALLPALDDNAITSTEWLITAIATVAALGVVWAVPNKPATPDGHEDRGRRPGIEPVKVPPPPPPPSGERKGYAAAPATVTGLPKVPKGPAPGSGETVPTEARWTNG